MMIQVLWGGWAQALVTLKSSPGDFNEGPVESYRSFGLQDWI